MYITGKLQVVLKGRVGYHRKLRLKSGMSIESEELQYYFVQCDTSMTLDTRPEIPRIVKCLKDKKRTIYTFSKECIHSCRKDLSL